MPYQATHSCGTLLYALRWKSSGFPLRNSRACLFSGQSEQTMAEQEARLQQAQEQLQELQAAQAQLQQALEASSAESTATIAALKATMECASTEAIELEQRRHVSGGHALQMTL